MKTLLPFVLFILLWPNEVRSDPSFCCPLSPRDWSPPSENSLVALFNEYSNRTSMASGLDFDLISARSQFVQAQIEVVSESISQEFPFAFLSESSVRLAASIRVMKIYFAQGKLMDANSMELSGSSRGRRYLDDLGNATYAFTAFENIPSLRSEIGGLSLIRWIAGGVELKSKVFRLIDELGRGEGLSSSTKLYFRALISDFDAAKSIAFENDPHDFLLIEEIQDLLSFSDSYGLALLFARGLHDGFEITQYYTPDYLGDIRGTEFSYEFLDAYRSDHQNEPYSLGDWEFSTQSSQ